MKRLHWLPGISGQTITATTTKWVLATKVVEAINAFWKK